MALNKTSFVWTSIERRILGFKEVYHHPCDGGNIAPHRTSEACLTIILEIIQKGADESKLDEEIPLDILAYSCLSRRCIKREEET